MARALPGIENVSERQIDELVAAVNANVEVRHSFGFRGNKPTQYGTGLIPYLHRLGPRRFVQNYDGVIAPETPEPAIDALSPGPPSLLPGGPLSSLLGPGGNGGTGEG